MSILAFQPFQGIRDQPYLQKALILKSTWATRVPQKNQLYGMEAYNTQACIVRHLNSTNFTDVGRYIREIKVLEKNKQKQKIALNIYPFEKAIRESKNVKKLKIGHSRNISTSKKTNYTVAYESLKLLRNYNEFSAENGTILHHI